MNDRSTEALLARRALAEKATPGPWEKHWQKESYWGYMLCGSIATEDAAHIAANSPDVVMADIDELIRLRAEVPRLEHEAQWLAELLAATYCTSEDRDCEKVRGKPLFERRAACIACWREAAREAGEESCR